MPRVRFLADYIYTPTLKRQVSTKFKAGPKIVLVNADCAEKAIAAGAAELAELQPAPTRPTRSPRTVGGPRARRARVQNAGS